MYPAVRPLPAAPARRGFTLIELLVVLAILAALVGPADHPGRDARSPATPLPEHDNHPEQSGLAYRIPGPGTHVYDLNLQRDEG